MDTKIPDKIYQINCLTEEINALYHQAALRLGVSDSVLLVLYMLHSNGGKCPLFDIYKGSGISKQTVNSALRRLEREGMVFLEKYRGRAKVVCLTDQGKAYAQQTAAPLFEAECRAFGDWREEELEGYLRLIGKHCASLRVEIEKLVKPGGES